MKIGIAMTFADGFSGGRLHAFLLGAELAAQEHDITFVCNQPPGFLDKLPPVPGRERVKFQKLKFDVLRPPQPAHFDLWIVVHERSLNGRFFAPVFEHARRQRVPMVLLTFETPNWQAALLPAFKSDWLDNLIDEPARMGAQVLSSTQIGRRWAREYFAEKPAEDFHVLSPPVTAGFYPESVERDPRLILAFTRRVSAHKGYDTILHLLNQRLRGWKIVLVDGFGLSYETANFITQKRALAGLDIEMRTNITDDEKYRLLKAARLLLYPSAFEGFGLPPGEARYWGTPVVCYELPVLREVYGESLRYVPMGDVDAFAAAVEAELARPPDFTPASEARRVGDFARWRADVRATFEAMVARAAPPIALPSAPVPLAGYDVVLADQLQNWNREDAAVAAGRPVAQCATLIFTRELYAQRKFERDARSLHTAETMLPPGTREDDLRGKLRQALEAGTTPWVLLSDDLIVCPAENVAAAISAAEQAGVAGAAIPLRWHFQADGIRHYRAASGELLAACGVFRRDFLRDCLQSTDRPGCRSQPGIDVSFLVAACGGRLVPAPGWAELLPPRTASTEFDALPGGRLTWHEAFRELRAVTHPIDPLPCRHPDDPAELAFLVRFREQLAVLLAQRIDGELSRSLIQELTRGLLAYCPLWRHAFEPAAPLRTFHRISGGFLRFGRAFLTARHMHTFLSAALIVAADDLIANPVEEEFIEPARGLVLTREQVTIVD